MPLDEPICPGVGQKCSTIFILMCVLQGTGPLSGAGGGWQPIAPKSSPSRLIQSGLRVSLLLHSSQLGYPRVQLWKRQNKILGARERGQVSFDGGDWREVREALLRCPTSRPQRFRKVQSAGPPAQQRRKNGAIHGVHQESFLFLVFTSKGGKDMQIWIVTSRGRTSHHGLEVKSTQSWFNPCLVTQLPSSVSLSNPICKLGIIIKK